MNEKISKSQRLISSSTYIKSKSEKNIVQYLQEEECIEDIDQEQKDLIHQVESMYGEEFDFTHFNNDELKNILQYALNCYNIGKQYTIDDLPLELICKIVPKQNINKYNDISNNKTKKVKEDNIYKWNKKFKQPTEEFDTRNAILEIDIKNCPNIIINEIQKLLDSYHIYAVSNHLQISELENSPEKIGLLIKGDNAYKFFKYEIGIHNFKINDIISNIAITVIPEIDYEKTEIKFDPNDFKIDTYRAAGAGGQHVNKTSSAVRVTHIPTGLVVQCQAERSQHKNKAIALQTILSKLENIKNSEISQDKYKIFSSGNNNDKIRTYDLNHALLIDHRVGFKTGISNGLNKIDINKINNIINKALVNYINNQTKIPTNDTR